MVLTIDSIPQSRSTAAPRFFNEIAGFETSSRPYLRKYGVSFHPDVTVRQSFANKKKLKVVFFIAYSDGLLRLIASSFFPRPVD